jgi:hypothetical protein
VNLIMNAKNIDNFWQGLGYFGVGAAAGALGAGVGAGISSAMAGGSFGAGFIGSSAALTSTGALSGMAVGAGAGFSSGFTTGLGNGLMGGQNFSEALWSGTKSGLIAGGTGAVLGGLVGGLDAVSNGREFWSGSYKQYDLKPALLASTDNYTSATEYLVPDDATLVNADQYKVYYKPENGVYGTKDYVSTGKYITKPIDGVATSKYSNMVYKVPDGGRVYVKMGGDVKLTMGVVGRTKVIGAYMFTNYDYGWQNAQFFINQEAYYNQWDMLFNLALKIR